MKNRSGNVFTVLALLALFTLNLQPSTAHAQGTAFTYQAQLQNNGNPASGTFNLQFSLYNTNTSGTAVAGPVTNSAVVITNGLFTVQINFGTNVFTGQTNWLQIGVETNGASPFTTLTPRQELTPVPYAITAANLTGIIPAMNLASGANGNFNVGPSGNAAMSGLDNTSIGDAALSSNSDGSANTADGYQALMNNVSGSYNLADGYHALINNTSGSDNVSVGRGSLFSNTVSSFDTAVGVEALNNDVSGSNNIAVGYLAGFNIIGNSNIDIGNEGLSTDTNTIRIGSGQSQTYIAGVITGNGAGLTNLNFSSQSTTGTNTMTRLLFPFVSNQTGFDTGLVIANTTSDPFGTAATNGTATIYFYGTGAPSPNTFTTPTIAAGTIYSTLLSTLASGFQGYLIVVCNFPMAHGYGFLSYGLTTSSGTTTMTPALVLPSQRSIVLPESLGQ